MDAKTPLSAFLEAAETDDPEVKADALMRYARQVRTHIDQLSSKQYWKAAETPEFVVLFLPNEMFFATSVVLVEGQTERQSFPLIFRRLGYDPDALGISIVEVGGKGNLVLIARVLAQLRIPHLIVFDSDRGRPAPGRDRVADEHDVVGYHTVTVYFDPLKVDVDALPDGFTVDDIVVHQQDVQAVVNAFWAGGAEAMMIQDQRIISTSAVRCVGNTLILQGRVYSPPYVIRAIGDPERLRNILDQSPEVSIYREYVKAVGLGYDVSSSKKFSFPAYAGSITPDYAAVAQ